MICDLNVPGGSSATTLHVWHNATNNEFVFDGIDEAGAPYDCRFPDGSVGGILPGSYWVEVIGTDQNDDVEFTTHFSGFEFTAGAGNDRAIGPLDGRYIVLDLGDGNDWVDVWGDVIDADLGAGNDVAIYGGSAASTSITFGGDGDDCVLGRPGAPDNFWGEGGNDRFDSRGTCATGSSCGEAALGGLGFDECAVAGAHDCEATRPFGWLACPSYVP